MKVRRAKPRRAQPPTCACAHTHTRSSRRRTLRLIKIVSESRGLTILYGEKSFFRVRGFVEVNQSVMLLLISCIVNVTDKK